MRSRSEANKVRKCFLAAGIFILIIVGFLLFRLSSPDFFKNAAVQISVTNENVSVGGSSAVTNKLATQVMSSTQQAGMGKAVAQNVSQATQHTADYWISLAQQKCVPHFEYKVHVSSRTTTNGAALSTPVGSDSLYQSDVSMVYSVDKGLRLDTSTGKASFSVDMAKMLEKMIPNLQWTVDGQETMAGEPAMELSSTNQRGSITLWIGRDDGAVLRYEQSVDGKQIASCNVTYTVLNGSLVPQKTEVYFPLTARTVTQDYTEYAVQANK